MFEPKRKKLTDCEYKTRTIINAIKGITLAHQLQPHCTVLPDEQEWAATTSLGH